MPFALMNLIFALNTGETAVTVPKIDFTDAFTTALTNISTDFALYAGIAIGVGLGIWGAPVAIKLVKRFFSALTH